MSHEELEEKYEELSKRFEKLDRENKELRCKNEQLKKLNLLNNQMISVLRELVDDNKARGVKLDDYLTRQKRIFDNKVNHGFNVTNIYQEARYILEEVTELMRAIEKNDRENMIEELADIIIFTYGCAEVARLGNLDSKVFEKMAINEKREYKITEEGDFVKTGGQLSE